MMSLLNELRIAGLGLFTVLCLGCSPGTDKTPGKSIGQNNESSAVTLVDASRSGSEAIRPSTVRASTAVGGESTSAAEFRKPDPASVPFDAQKAAAHQKAWADHLAVPHEFTNSVEMKFVIIPPGNFQMGSPADEPGRDRDEFQHLVGITKPFYIGVYEVAQAEFKRVTGRNPSYFCPEATGWVRLPGIDTSTFPVERVSWKAAVEFCEKLSSRPDEKNAGRMYRLPTEAEWEFACRAGTETPFHFGWELNGTEANIRGDRPCGTSKCSPYLDRTAKVGSYQPNAFGVFDMHGNGVRIGTRKNTTWTHRGTIRLEQQKEGSESPRGGSWANAATHCRSAIRNYVDWFKEDDGLGFRVVATVPEFEMVEARQ